MTTPTPSPRFYWYIIRKDGYIVPRSGLPTFPHDQLFTREEVNKLNEYAKSYKELKLSPDQVRSTCINKLRNPVVEGIEPPQQENGGAWL